YARLRLQLGKKDKLPLVRLACLQHVLNEQGANGSVRGTRLRRDGLKLFSYGRDDLLVDGRREGLTISLCRPPPQQMDPDSAHDDGGEHETGNGEANSNSHLASSARRATAGAPHKSSA